jgi:polyhydroxybutyrate depolymerase
MGRFISRPWAIGALVAAAAIAAAAWYLLWSPMPQLPGGRVEHVVVEHDGRARSYQIVSPPRQAPGASLLFVFHRAQSDATEIRRTAGRAIERVTGDENVIVVYPDGFEGHFNDCRREAPYSARTLNVDDVGFTRGIVERLAAQGRIDRGRVFAIGLSNGGQFALRLALEEPALVRGVVAVGASLPAPGNLDCRVADGPLRVVAFVAGTDDAINPYDGGPSTLFGFADRGDVLSAAQSAEWFANRMGAAVSGSGRIGEASGLAASRRDWMAHHAQVRLVTIEGGGHTFPQADYRYPRLFGATFQDDSVLHSVWRLLADTGQAGDGEGDGEIL